MKMHIVKSTSEEQGGVRVEFVTKTSFSPTEALNVQGFTGESGKIGLVSTNAVYVGIVEAAGEEAWREAAGAGMQAAWALFR